MLSSFTIGYVECLLTKFLDQFSPSPTLLGLSFLPMNLSFTVAAPLFGWITDTRVSPSTVLILGLTAILASFVSIFLACPSYLITMAALAVVGCGTAAVQVSRLVIYSFVCLFINLCIYL